MFQKRFVIKVLRISSEWKVEGNIVSNRIYIKVLWNDIRFVINRAETLRFSEMISTCIFLFLLHLSKSFSHSKRIRIRRQNLRLTISMLGTVGNCVGDSFIKFFSAPFFCRDKIHILIVLQRFSFPLPTTSFQTNHNILMIL